MRHNTGLIGRVCLFVVLASTVYICSASEAGTKEFRARPPYPRAVQDVANITQLIIKFRDPSSQKAAQIGTNSLNKLGTLAGLKLVQVRQMSGGAHVLRLPTAVTALEAREICARMKLDPAVEYVEPDYPMYPMIVPNDPRYNEQWHFRGPLQGSLGGINAESAWDITTGDQSIVVAVLDTGQLPHADMQNRTIAGYDFITDPVIAGDGGGRDADPTDPGDFCAQSSNPSSWHGTHVAGTIAAATNNGVGVAGVNWQSKVQPVRVLGRCDANGAASSTSDILDGAIWAAGGAVPGVPANLTPARVLNLSLGVYIDAPCPASAQSVIDAIVSSGVVVVVAAGNDESPVSGATPANCNNVITVHANARDGGYATYSNFGPQVEISAPGGVTNFDNTNPNGVLSTLDSGSTVALNDGTYVFYEGTSMATPHVAGVVSLMLSVNPSLTPTQVLSAIQSTARAFPSAPKQCVPADCGAGIIDAAAVVAAVSPTPDTMPDQFAFVDQVDVTPSTIIVSNQVTITGINTATPISVTGGDYSIGCGATFTNAAGTITNNQTVCVRHTSAAANSTAANTTLTIGGVGDTFTSTTIGAGPDSTPNQFSFIDQTNVPRSSLITSAPVAISGINMPAAVTVTNGEYSVGCTGTFTTAAGSVANGETVCVRHTSAAGFSAQTSTILTVDTVNDAFTSTTELEDIQPDRFTFTPQLNTALGSVVTSNTVAITGINSAAPVTVAGGEYSIGCNGTFTTAAGTIISGETVCVRHTTATTGSTTVNTTLSVGDISGVFSSTTLVINPGGGGDDDDDPPDPPGAAFRGEGTGSGGCVMKGEHSDFDPLWLLALVAAATRLRGRRTNSIRLAA